MARWAGDAVGRLERAALFLFAQHGYDRTTVTEIARRAELTERSFYRHFADKREVLFGGGPELEAHLVAGVDRACDGLAPLAALMTAFAAAPDVMRPREFVRERAAVIAANPALQERELIKLAALSAALSAALIRRGAQQRAAQLATDLGMAALRLATQQWLDDDGVEFADLLDQAAADLAGVVAQLPKI